MESSVLVWDSIGIFLVSGEDSERYLHGRVTQNIKSLGGDKSSLALVLSPQGKIEGKFAIVRYLENFLLITDPFTSDTSKSEFLKSLLRFKVADKLELKDLTTSSVGFSLFFTDELKATKKSESIRKNLLGKNIKFHNFLTSRAKLNSIDFVCFDVDKRIISEILDDVQIKVKVLNDNEFALLRVEALFPLMEVDINNSVLAPDIPLDSYISKGKGCYAGQEVVEMASARGRANKKLLKFSSTKSIDNFTLPIPIFGDENEVGFMTSIVNISSGFKGLGFLKTKHLDQIDLYIKEIENKISISYEE